MRAGAPAGWIERALCVAVAVWAAGSGTARAEWTSSGPYGGAAEIVRVTPLEPGLVLAATANALLYQSRNGGASWTRTAFPAQLAGTLHALEVDPRSRGTWYAGIESDNPVVAGVYKTQDGGATWSLLAGLRGRSVWAMAIWPGDAEWMVAGTSDGVFLSGDGGASWRRISPESNRELRPVVALAFDPADRKIIYAGTTHLPWRTRNGGEDWESIHSGMIDDSDVFSVAVEPGSPDSVFASACSGVYHSIDGGASWKRLATPAGAFRAYLVALDPAHAGVVFAATSAGLLRSADRGATWKSVTPEAVRSMAFDPANREKIFLASTTGGLLVSRDDGRTVAEFNTGFVNRNFTAVAAAGPNLYAASVYEPGSGGIFRSVNRGLRWERVAGPEGGENIVRLAARPDDPKVLFAAGYRGLYRSADGGNTWAKPEAVPGGGLIRALAPLAGGRLLAGTANGLFAFSEGAWTAIALPIAEARAQVGETAVDDLQASPGGVLAAITAAGAFRSEDSGRSWAACGQPVVDAAWYGLAFDSGPNEVALAATSRGLFRSTDRCASWMPVRGGLEPATASAVVFHPERRGEAFTAQSGRIFRSTDAGVTWTPLAGDGPADAYPDSLFFLPGAPQRLFALFPRRGVLSHSIDAPASILPAVISKSTSRGAN
jgi:photosystem II stability/assembly factor-like uncharacterized protein